jgi:hypothetical protein
LHILTAVEAGLFPKTGMVLLWVLGSVYRLPSEEIAHSIENLIQADTLSTKPSLCVIFNPVRFGKYHVRARFNRGDLRFPMPAATLLPGGEPRDQSPEGSVHGN